MKKGVRRGKSFGASILFASLFLVMSFVIAGHTITPSSLSVNEDTGYVFNISVENTDTLMEENITQVNITIPSSFILLTDSNGTDTGTHTFTNTSTVLSWENDGLVMNLTTNYFWFNATAVTPGNYNLTIMTTNASDTLSTNISIVVNDSTVPSSVEFASPSESEGANISRLNILVNITATDNGVIDTITAFLYNSTSDLINSSTASSSTLYVNFSGLSDGTYYVNATVNDTFGNSNASATRTITIETVAPVVTLIAPANAVSSTTDAYNFTFNVTDDRIISSCSLILNGVSVDSITTVNNTGGTNGIYRSSIDANSYTWSINCTDNAGNVGNSSSRSLTVESSTTSTPDPSESSSRGTQYYPTYRPTATELTAGYRKVLYRNWKVSFSVDSASHSVSVDEITATSAKITLSSDPQEATLTVGEERKYDVSSDGYYDVLVKLNSIDASNRLYPKADLTIKSIYELVPTESAGSKESSTAGESEAGEENKSGESESTGESSNWVWITIGIILLAAILVFVILFFNKRKKRR